MPTPTPTPPLRGLDTANRPKSTLRCIVSLSDFEFGIFFPDGLESEFASMFGDLRIVPSSTLTREEWRELINDYDPDVVMTAWSSFGLPENFGQGRRQAPYICNLTGSVRHLVTPSHFKNGVLVSDWGSSAAKSVAEAGLMLTLMALRRASHWQHVMHVERGWAELDGNKGQLSLFDRRVGIHGLGRVAQAYIALIKPFSPQIFTYCPGVPPQLLEELGVTAVDSLEELCDTVEIFVEMAALTPETLGSVTEEILRRLPPHGVFVNVGRGPVADENALAKLANDGRLRVALDVYAHEPLATNSPLRDNPAIIIFPHQAGPTEDHMRHLGTFAMENVKRYLRNEPIQARISLDVFEKMS